MVALQLTIIWAAAIYRIWITVRRPDLARVAFTVATVLVAFSYTVRFARLPIDDALGSANLAELIRHLLLVAAAFCTQLFLLGLRFTSPPRRIIQLRAGVAVAVAVTMTVLFVVAPVHDDEVLPATQSLDIAFGGHIEVVAYRLILAGYLAYCLIDNSRLCWRYRRVPGNDVRSFSLVLIGLGCAIAAVTAVLTGALILVVYTSSGQRSAGIEDTLTAIGNVFALVAVVTLAAGILMPGVAWTLVRTQRAHRRRRHLDPLWHRLTAALPDVVLRGHGGASIAERAELLAVRRRVEILDVLPSVAFDQSAAARIRASVNPARAAGQELRGRHWSIDCASGTPLPHVVEIPSEPHAELAAVLDMATGYREAPHIREQAPAATL